jgi:carbamoyltransferase
MVNVLGLNFGHDGSAAVIRNNRLVCAISNERLSRVKKAIGVTREMVQYVLDGAGLRLTDINCIAFATYIYSPDNYVKLVGQTGEEVTTHLVDLFGDQVFKQGFARIDKLRLPAIMVNHHIAHCASAYYTSPFEQAACMSVDASGRHPEACSVFSHGRGNKLFYFHCPGIMIGNAYSAFTEKLGLGPGLTKAGTLMGLAPYGKPLPAAVERAEEFGRSWYENKFQEVESVRIRYLWNQITGLDPFQEFPKDQSDSKQAMDIAASIQYIFEQALTREAAKLYSDTAEFNGGNLCLSGGSMLNSETNMKIARESKFERIHLFPGCGDDGTAVGAALFATHHVFDQPREQYQMPDYTYLGRKPLLNAEEKNLGVLLDLDYLAHEIAEGKVVAWFQGAAEFGPRALGNRSILADPRRAEMKDHLNQKIKQREWFRPFAPAVMADKAADWFELDFESKLMLFIAKVKQPEKIPAVTHVDNTARVQTVSVEDNPKFYDLLAAFEAATGVPVLLNTSLNVNNEPLVETPADARRFFEAVPVDILVLEDRMIVR